MAVLNETDTKTTKRDWLGGITYTHGSSGELIVNLPNSYNGHTFYRFTRGQMTREQIDLVECLLGELKTLGRI